MKRLLPPLLSLLLVSCGTGVKRMPLSGRPPLSLAVTRRAARAADRDEASESPGEAAAFYLLKRTGGAPLPVEKMFEAKRHKDSMRVYSVAARRFVAERSAEIPRDANVGTWQPVGPGNIGGRTRAFVIRPDDPHTMYAGSAGGGVWKTTDGGKTWKPLTDLLPSLAIGALAMDPAHPDTLYAGTGELFTIGDDDRGNSIRGAGIFKTTNGGATWTQLRATNIPDFWYVTKIVISPNQSQRLYAATWFGVYASTDGGATWQLVLDQSADNQPGCQDLVIRTDIATDYLFASCAASGYDNPAIFRNTDAAGAGKWQSVFTAANMARTSLALAPSSQGTVYAAASSSEDGNYSNGLLGIYRSTSNGDPGSWTAQVTNRDPNLLNTLLFTNPTGATADTCDGGTPDFASQGDYDNVIAVDPLNPNVVWVGGIDLFRSDDGGQNWGIAAFWEATPAPQGAHADNHVILFSPGYDGVSNQTLFASGDGGIYRTDNALAPTATGPLATCFPYPTAIAWSNVNNGYAVTQFYNGAVYPGAAAYLGGAQDNDTLRGSDATGPNAWTTPAFTGDGGYVAIDPTDPNTFFVTGTKLSIRKTTDGGSTYSSVTKGITEKDTNFLFISPLVMDPGNAKRLYTGGRTLWRTTDGAKTWAAASTALSSSSGSISIIAVAPSDPDHVVFGTGNGFVFHSNAALSSDRTTLWPSSQPRPGFVSGLAFDPANPAVVYATYSQYKDKPSQSHVYKSTDAGVTWRGIDGSGASGIPDIPVFSLIVDPQDAAHLYLATDIGLFASTDGGATWSQDSNPFADSVTEILVLDRSAGQNNLIAFTHGRGVWKTTLPGSGTPCQYSMAGDGIKFPAFGSTASIKITTAANCAWSALSTNPDFSVSSPAVGRGNGTVTVSTQFVNNTPQADATQVLVQNHSVSVTQDAAQVATGNDDVSAPFPFGAVPAVVIQDTTSATESSKDPVHSCTRSADFKTVWFLLKAPGAGKMSLTVLDEQPDGSDAGAVLTLYPVVNGQTGQELGCYLFPQTSSGGKGGGAIPLTVKAGDTYLVEVSATTFRAPAGASLVGGNLSLWVTAPN